MSLLRLAKQKTCRVSSGIDELGRPFTITRDVNARSSEQSNVAIEAGVQIPVVRDDGRHPNDLTASLRLPADDPRILGTVRAFWPAADDQFALLDLKPGVELPNDISASIWLDKIEAGGRTYAPAVRHVLLTKSPAVSGLGSPVFLRQGGPLDQAAMLRESGVLVEQLRWHLAVPHSFEHPGHHLLLAAIACGTQPDSGVMLASLQPQEKTIPPADEKLLRATLKTGLGIVFSPDEEGEFEHYLTRLDCKSGCDPFAAAATVAKLLFKDRLSPIAQNLAALVPPEVLYANPPRGGVRLALGQQQWLPAASAKIVWAIVDDDFGLDLADAESEATRQRLLEHDWGANISVFTIVSEIVAAWIDDHVAAYREKVESAGPRLSAAQIDAASRRLDAINEQLGYREAKLDAKIECTQSQLRARDERHNAEVIERERILWRRACPHLNF